MAEVPGSVQYPTSGGSSMGLFDGIASGLTGGLLSYLGTEETNRSNKQMAQQQMSFQSLMDETKYQRAVDDLKKAGLNPMMAYGSMSTNAPSGALGYAAQNSLGSAVDAYNRSSSTGAEVDLKKEQEENAKATTDATKATAVKLAQDTQTSKASELNLIANTKKVLQDARTSSATEARERAQAAAIEDQRARDSATAPLYNVLERGTQYIKEKANQVSSAFSASRVGKREGPRNITIYGTPKE